MDRLALTAVIPSLTGNRNRASYAINVNLGIVHEIDCRACVDRPRVGYDVFELEPAIVASVEWWKQRSWQTDTIVAAKQSDVDLILEALLAQAIDSRCR